MMYANFDMEIIQRKKTEYPAHKVLSRGDITVYATKYNGYPLYIISRNCRIVDSSYFLHHITEYINYSSRAGGCYIPPLY